MKYIEFPKFHIEKTEFILHKDRLKKMVGAGVSAVIGYYIYTLWLEQWIDNLLHSIIFLHDLLEIVWIKVFIIGFILFWIKDILD